MTIIFLCPSFYPKIGGVEKHSFEIAKRLVKKGFKIIVITEGERDKTYKFGKITIHQFYFGKANWFKKFKIWKKLFLKRNLFKRADIIHCHDVFFWYLPFRFLYLRKRVYTTFHGYETNFPVSNKAIFIRKISEKLSMGNICVGDYIKKWYGTIPTFVTYGAIDHRIQKYKFKTINKKIKILFLGRIEKDNGVEIYSNALKNLNKATFVFEACGDGSLRSEFEFFGKVHGFVKDTKKYILNSDIVFASSYLSIMDALNFKKTVFSVFDNPIKKDYLYMSPFSKFIIITSSHKNLADAIKLIRTKNIEKKINLGYKWVKDQTWNNIVSKYLELFNL